MMSSGSFPPGQTGPGVAEWAGWIDSRRGGAGQGLGAVTQSSAGHLNCSRWSDRKLGIRLWDWIWRRGERSEDRQLAYLLILKSGLLFSGSICLSCGLG